MGSFSKLLFALAAVIVALGAVWGSVASIYLGHVLIALLFGLVALFALTLFILAIYIGSDYRGSIAVSEDRLVVTGVWPGPGQLMTQPLDPHRWNSPVISQPAEASLMAADPLSLKMIMAKYSWLDRQLHREQTKLAIPEYDAVQMRHETFTQCSIARLSGSGVLYPTLVSDPLAMDIQLEFAKRVRPYRPTSPSRDSTFVPSMAKLLINASDNLDQDISWDEALGVVFSYFTRDELIVRFFVEREIHVRDIAALLVLDTKHVQHIIKELDDLFKKISRHAGTTRKNRKASQMAKQMDARLSGALREWMFGRKTA